MAKRRSSEEKKLVEDIIKGVLESNEELKASIEKAAEQERAKRVKLPIKVSTKKQPSSIETLKKQVDSLKKPKSAKESAKVLKNISETKPPLDVKMPSLSGKSAAESAEAFLKSGSPASESARVFEGVGTLPSEVEADKKSLRDILKSIEKPARTAEEAAEVLAPKELPAVRKTTIPTTTKSLVSPISDTIETTGKVISEQPVSAAASELAEEAVEKGAKELAEEGSEKALTTLGEKGLVKTAQAGGKSLLKRLMGPLSALPDLYGAYKEYEKNDMRGVSGSLGGAVGGFVGGLGGGALGSGVASIPLGIAGAVGGSSVGERMGTGLYDYLAGDEKVFTERPTPLKPEPPLDESASPMKSAMAEEEEEPEAEEKSVEDIELDEEDAPEQDEATPAVDEEGLPVTDRTERKSQYDDFLEDLKKARSERDLGLLATTIGKAGETIGTGISGLQRFGTPTKPVSGDFYELLKKRGETGVEDVVSTFKLKQKMEEETEEQDEDDPTSEKSKRAQQALIKMLPNIKKEQIENLSYSDIKDMDIPSMALKLRTLDVKQESEETKAQQKATTQQEKAASAQKESLTKYIVSENDRTRKSPQYKDLSRVSDSVRRLEDAIKNPSGIKDIGVIFKYMKDLDPESTVRQSEIELTQEAISKWNKLNIELSKYNPSSSPMLLDERTKRDILDLTKQYYEARQNAYNKMIKNKIDVATTRFGGDPKEVQRLMDIESTLPSEDVEQPDASKSEETKPTDKTLQPKEVTKSGLRLY
jgi:hypothetical protein